MGSSRQSDCLHRKRRRLWLSSVLILVSVGCHEELGPIPFKTTRVRGVVQVGNKVVNGGWIEFLPIQGTVGRLRTAPIGRDGTFEVDRVSVGKNAISVMNAPIDPRMLGLRTPIHRTITERSPTELKIDLLEARLRYLRSQGEGL